MIRSRSLQFGIRSLWTILRSFVAVTTSLFLLASQSAAAAVDERQPSAAEIVQPVAKSYQELQQALSAPPAKTPDQFAARLDKLFRALEQAEKHISRETFDPRAIIDKVGKDPRKIFEWVRDNTYFVPYRGLLRGEKGVLMDRLGNSLDRAMLLYALLRFVNQPARLARGTLTEAQATDVLAKGRPFPTFEQRTSSSPSASATDEFVARYAQQNHVDPARMRKALDQLAAQQQHMKEMVQKRTTAQAAMIAEAVGPPPANAAAEERAAQVKAITDHWWVQWQNGASWLDLDPTPTLTRPGQTLAHAQRTFRPEDIPAELYHEVQIHMVVEQWDGQNLNQRPVLTSTFRPADLPGIGITLSHHPMKWPADLNWLSSNKPLESLKQTLIAQHEWLPVLTVGKQNIVQGSFTDSGDINQTPLAPVLGGSAGQLGRDIGAMLSTGQIGQNSGRAVEKKKYLTAEWIEFEIRSPGQAIRKIRREIFDLVGPSVRSKPAVSIAQIVEGKTLERGMALMGTLDTLTLGNDLSSSFVDHMRMANLLADREVLLNVIGTHADWRDPKVAQQQLGAFTTVPNELYSLVVARQQWSRSSSLIYINSPNIFTFYRYPIIADKAGLGLRSGFDIVANNVAVATQSEHQPFLVQLQQGVLDTNAEAVIASDCGNLTETRTPCDQVRNTAEMVASSPAVSWRLIRARGDQNLKAGALSADDLARVNLELDRGFLAIIPTRPIALNNRPAVGWWTIDPKSGNTLGIGDSGRGQTATEQMEMLAQVALVIRVLHIHWNLFRCLYPKGESSMVSSMCDTSKCMTVFLLEVLVLGFGGASDAGVIWASIVGEGADFVKDAVNTDFLCSKEK
jgi:hypothetical protein